MRLTLQVYLLHISLSDNPLQAGTSCPISHNLSLNILLFSTFARVGGWNLLQILYVVQHYILCVLTRGRFKNFRGGFFSGGGVSRLSGEGRA